MKLFSIVVFMVLFSCNGQKKAAAENGEGADGESHRLTLLLRDNYSGSDTAETLIVKDRKSLQKFFSKVNRTRKPGLPVPDIDFTKEMVLIYCSGYRPLGGQDSLYVAKGNDRELLLRSKVVKGGKKQASTVRVSPFSVYTLPLTTKRIVFDKGVQKQ